MVIHWNTVSMAKAKLSKLVMPPLGPTQPLLHSVPLAVHWRPFPENAHGAGSSSATISTGKEGSRGEFRRRAPGLLSSPEDQTLAPLPPHSEHSLASGTQLLPDTYHSRPAHTFAGLSWADRMELPALPWASPIFICSWDGKGEQIPSTQLTHMERIDGNKRLRRPAPPSKPKMLPCLGNN